MSRPVPAHSQPGAPRLPPVPGPARARLWHATPPAIFPPILGLFGLGLGWKRAAVALDVPGAIGDLILGAVSLLYLFALGAYLAKTAARPAVLLEDLRTLPGRAGLATASMAGMLLAAALLLGPGWRGAAAAVLVLSMLAHLVLIGLVVRLLRGAPLEARRMTPVWHLVFVGPIVGGVAAGLLGWRGAAEVILILSVAAAVTVWGGTLVLMRRRPVPAPLRPTLAIHLSPAALLGIVAAGIGLQTAALGFGWLSLLIAALLLGRLRDLVAAGFSPFWGAFTFPLAALANLMLILSAQGQGALFGILGAVALVAATLLIPWIAWRVLRMWFAGQLAVKTNAASI